MNLKAKIYICVTSTIQRCPQQNYWNFYDWRFFSFATGVRSTLICEYLREFSKKIETVQMGFSGAGGKLIDEKNQKQKISWHCPFNRSLEEYWNLWFSWKRDHFIGFYWSCFQTVSLTCSFQFPIYSHHHFKFYLFFSPDFVSINFLSINDSISN